MHHHCFCLLIFLLCSKHKLCLDGQLENLGVLTICKEVRNREELLNSPLPDLWHDLTTKLQSETVCVKPARDGCSTGVARLWYASIHYLHDVTIVSTLKVHIVDMNCEHMGYHMHPCPYLWESPASVFIRVLVSGYHRSLHFVLLLAKDIYDLH